MKQSTNFSVFNNETGSTTSYRQKSNVSPIQNKQTGSNTSSTNFRQLQQERFQKAAEFVLSLSSLLMLSNGKGGMPIDLNTMTAQVFTDAISCTTTGLHIDYQNVLVSQGNLPRGKPARARAIMDSIYFAWDDNSSSNKDRGRDMAILVAYCEALNLCLYNSWAARRRDGDGILQVPQFYGHKVQTWLSFISADGKSIANSIYAGSVTLSDFH